MISYVARFNPDGQYTWYGTEQDPKPESGKFIGEVKPSTQYHDLSANRPVDMPPKPSDRHEFDYSIKEWKVNTELAWHYVYIERSRKLMDTDWLVTKAIETGEPMPAGWATYRQALRDITQQSDPMSIVWPVQPT